MLKDNRSGMNFCGRIDEHPYRFTRLPGKATGFLRETWGRAVGLPMAVRMFEFLLAFGFMGAVTVGLQAARFHRAKKDVASSEACPEAENIVRLFAEAEHMSQAA